MTPLTDASLICVGVLTQTNRLFNFVILRRAACVREIRFRCLILVRTLFTRTVHKTFYARLVRLIACIPLTLSVALCSSVLTHEAVIDAAWDPTLKPALLSAYPNSTPEELKRAHGFAYGGAIIQDLGYYPHGNKEFSDMTHYVRTGAFVMALIQDAHTLDELAFALGGLSHYASDVNVHPSATNPGEAILYPKLKRRFGPIIYYEQAPEAHIKTEFGFDVLEVAKGRFAPAAYHDFVGFHVAEDLLARAFQDTYGIALTDLFGNLDKSIGSYRRDVSIWIPRASKVAWAQREEQIKKSEPTASRHTFVYTMRRAAYEHDWGKDYARPSLGDRILGILLKILPPIGPLGKLKFRMPTPQVEALFMASFDRSVHQYDTELSQERNHSLELDDPNYDIGHPVQPGEYKLEDKAYAYWLDQLAKNNFRDLSPAARANILAYYSDKDAPISTKSDHKEWARVQNELRDLRQSAYLETHGSSAEGPYNPGTGTSSSLR